MKRIGVIALLIILAVGAAAGYIYSRFYSKRWRYDKPVISNYPECYSRKGSLREIPKYKYTLNGNKIYNPYQLDLRGMNLSSLDLSGSLDDLLRSRFDNMTAWPEKLPLGFDPVKIIRMAKTPGLGLKKLHQNGISGKNVSVAVIGPPLFIDHAEYATNLRLYDEIGDMSMPANEESSKIVSIIIGKNSGAAPEADLFYIAAASQQTGIRDNPNFRSKPDYKSLVKAIDRIIKINRTLPDDRRIRVVYINDYINETYGGYKELVGAIEKAKSKDIFVITNSLFSYSSVKEMYGIDIAGLGRRPDQNPDLTSSYGITAYMNDMWNEIMSGENKYAYGQDVLLLPMDSIRSAYTADSMSYAFYTMGTGCEPSAYVAGIYALACQAIPDINPEVFFKEALNTGDILEVERDGKKVVIGRIMNPIKLIEGLKSSAR